MDSNTLFHERYRLEKFLGSGTYSKVWLADDEITGGTQVALKIFATENGLDDYGLNMFAHEFSLVSNINDPYILRPQHYDVCNRRPYLVLPYCKDGSVKSKTGHLKEKEAWDIIADVSRGLSVLHSMTPPIIHQDIKPDNIMVSDSGHYMITDFGVSTHLNSTLRRSVGANYSYGGTKAYMAPERFSRHKTSVMASDIYSLGATLYDLLSGEPPFGEEGGLLQKSGAEIPELEGNFSSELKELLEKCLALNSWERPTTEDLIAKAKEMKDKSKGSFSRKTEFFNGSDNEKLGEDEDSDKPYDGNHHISPIYYVSLSIIGIAIGVVLGFIL